MNFTKFVLYKENMDTQVGGIPKLSILCCTKGNWAFHWACFPPVPIWKVAMGLLANNLHVGQQAFGFAGEGREAAETGID